MTAVQKPFFSKPNFDQLHDLVFSSLDNVHISIDVRIADLSSAFFQAMREPNKIDGVSTQELNHLSNRVLEVLTDDFMNWVSNPEAETNWKTTLAAVHDLFRSPFGRSQTWGVSHPYRMIRQIGNEQVDMLLVQLDKKEQLSKPTKDLKNLLKTLLKENTLKDGSLKKTSLLSQDKAEKIQNVLSLKGEKKTYSTTLFEDLIIEKGKTTPFLLVIIDQIPQEHRTPRFLKTVCSVLDTATILEKQDGANGAILHPTLSIFSQDNIFPFFSYCKILFDQVKSDQSLKSETEKEKRKYSLVQSLLQMTGIDNTVFSTLKPYLQEPYFQYGREHLFQGEASTQKNSYQRPQPLQDFFQTIAKCPTNSAKINILKLEVCLKNFPEKKKLLGLRNEQGDLGTQIEHFLSHWNYTFLPCQMILFIYLLERISSKDRETLCTQTLLCYKPAEVLQQLRA